MADPFANVAIRPAGLEPATLGSEDRCSIQLSYGRAGNTITIVAVLTGVSSRGPMLVGLSRFENQHFYHEFRAGFDQSALRSLFYE